MAYEFEFDGVKYKNLSHRRIENEFITIVDEDGQLLFTSRTFHHDEEGFEFDYCYVVKVDDLAFFCDPGRISGYFGLVVLSGVEDVFEAINKYPVPLVRLNVRYDVDDIPGGFYHVLDNDEVKAFADNAANAYYSIDHFLGFYLDRSCSYIGTTGWDYIRFALGQDDIMDWVRRQ